jgi:hypothetical protein
MKALTEAYRLGEFIAAQDGANRYTVANGGPTSKGLVKVGMAGSSLCLQCHNK